MFIVKDVLTGNRERFYSVMSMQMAYPDTIVQELIEEPDFLQAVFTDREGKKFLVTKEAGNDTER